MHISKNLIQISYKIKNQAQRGRKESHFLSEDKNNNKIIKS